MRAARFPAGTAAHCRYGPPEGAKSLHLMRRLLKTLIENENSNGN